MEFKIEEPVTVAECKGASAFMTATMNDLFHLGYGPNEGATPWYYKDKVIVARWNDEIVGLIAYRFEKGDGSLWVILGGVKPNYRLRGCYTKLFAKLVEVARKEGAVRIEASTHVTNNAMRCFNKKLGRTETHVISRYDIPALGEEPGPRHNCEEMGCKVNV